MTAGLVQRTRAARLRHTSLLAPCLPGYLPICVNVTTVGEAAASWQFSMHYGGMFEDGLVSGLQVQGRCHWCHCCSCMAGSPAQCARASRPPELAPASNVVSVMMPNSRSTAYVPESMVEFLGQFTLSTCQGSRPVCVQTCIQYAGSAFNRIVALLSVGALVTPVTHAGF